MFYSQKMVFPAPGWAADNAPAKQNWTATINVSHLTSSQVAAVDQEDQDEEEADMIMFMIINRKTAVKLEAAFPSLSLCSLRFAVRYVHRHGGDGGKQRRDLLQQIRFGLHQIQILSRDGEGPNVEPWAQTPTTSVVDLCAYFFIFCLKYRQNHSYRQILTPVASLLLWIWMFGATGGE